ncbi:class I SAM-dependent methyltransferase [Rhodococcus aerolatus]
MTATIGIGFDDVFERALAGLPCWVSDRQGRRHDLPVRRWLGGEHSSPTDRARDLALLARCSGATLDLGCGPGRLVAELHARGEVALGIDSSAVAVAHTLARGGRAVQGDVHGPALRDGSWDRVLLADGNIGIGGDPVRLLRRAATLLAPGGRVVAELAQHTWTGDVRIETEHAVGEWFPWAQVGPDTVGRVAHESGLAVVDLAEVAGVVVATLEHG